MARKTIPLADLVDRTNAMLRDSLPELHEGRISLCVLLESILQDAGQYHGFQFINDDGSTDLGPDYIPPDDPRHSRRRYYGPR